LFLKLLADKYNVMGNKMNLSPDMAMLLPNQFNKPASLVGLTGGSDSLLAGKIVMSSSMGRMSINIFTVPACRVFVLGGWMTLSWDNASLSAGKMFEITMESCVLMDWYQVCFVFISCQAIAYPFVSAACLMQS